MSQSQRWLTLVHEIDVRPGQTAKQLAEKLGCSMRTIQRDIDRLPDLGFVAHNESGYRFFDKPFLSPLALTREEVVSVILAQRLAARQLDGRAVKALENAVDKMRRGFCAQDKIMAEKIEGRTAVVPGADTEADVARDHLQDLTDAVQRHQQVLFDYQGRDDQAKEERHVEPLGLSFQDSRWYLHAYDLKRKGERTFRLGRMSALRVTSVRFEPKIKFTAEHATFHQWDLGEGDPVELTLTVSSGLARWFEENKPHPSILVQGNLVTLSVNDPESFLRWFASLDDAELTSPPHFRDSLHRRLNRLRDLYVT